MAGSNPRRRPTATAAPQKAQCFSPTTTTTTTKTLRKGATFHSPSSAAISSIGEASSPPKIARSWSGLEESAGAGRRRAALTTLDDFDDAMSKPNDECSAPSTSPRKQASLRDNAQPVPAVLCTRAVAKPSSDKRTSASRQVRRSTRHNSDSGLGSSIISTTDKCSLTLKTARISANALTGSSKAKQALPGLRQRALDRIQEHIIRPLMKESDPKEFHSILKEVPRRVTSKEIVCLRDVEKTLLLTAPGSAKSVLSYLEFCYRAVDCVQATVEYLHDNEQTRLNDRPYTNGYFIDLKDQVLEYGRQLQAARAADGASDLLDLHKYVSQLAVALITTNVHERVGKIELWGGITKNGQPAQLVRVNADGTAVSLANGKPVDMDDAPAQFKRSLSEQREDEEEIMRSMARRKKNANPEELVPRRCREPGCTKEFKRSCDLTKHEKTHSRPWKCPHKTCKYHQYGWPTEKEMDRHVNDRHSESPAMYECLFHPCPYKSKRESNCKQHMEKAHGWHYNRSKSNGKKSSSTPVSQFQQTPPLGSESTPSTTPAFSAPTPPQELDALPRDVSASVLSRSLECQGTHGYHMETPVGVGLGLEGLSSSDAPGLYPPYQDGPGFILDEDLYAATAQVPSHAPRVTQSLDKLVAGGVPMYASYQLCGPQLGVSAPPSLAAPAQPPFGQTQFAAPMTASALKQEDAMFYSPPDSFSDETFEEPHFRMESGDFPLYSTNVEVGSGSRLPLFEEPPSDHLGFSQTSQPEIFQQMEWTSYDYTNMQQV